MRKHASSRRPPQTLQCSMWSGGDVQTRGDTRADRRDSRRCCAGCPGSPRRYCAERKPHARGARAFARRDPCNGQSRRRRGTRVSASHRFGGATGHSRPGAGHCVALVASLAPANCPPLSVVASQHEFNVWGGGRSSYTLLKIHGSIRKANNHIEIIDPVVEDELEYAGLSPARLAALDVLTRAPTVIITGYSGLDIDVYDPLIERLARPETIWAAPEVWLQVRRDLSTLPRAHVIDGRPAGLAATALRDIFGCTSVPAWPQIALHGAAFADRAASWATQFRAHASVGARAEAYAWFLADIGLYDNAHVLLKELHKSTGRRADPRLRSRLADVLYDRHRPGDRRAAAQIWIQAIFAPSRSRAQRAYACTRLGEIGRGIAIRGPLPLRPIGLATAVLGPGAAVAMTRNGQVDDPARQRAPCQRCPVLAYESSSHFRHICYCRHVPSPAGSSMSPRPLENVRKNLLQEATGCYSSGNSSMS